jgi:hypothetical protein
MTFSHKNELPYGINQIHLRCYEVTENLSNFKVEKYTETSK